MNDWIPVLIALLIMGIVVFVLSKKTGWNLIICTLIVVAIVGFLIGLFGGFEQGLGIINSFAFGIALAIFLVIGNLICLGLVGCVIGPLLELFTLDNYPKCKRTRRKNEDEEEEEIEELVAIDII